MTGDEVRGADVLMNVLRQTDASKVPGTIAYFKKTLWSKVLGFLVDRLITLAEDDEPTWQWAAGILKEIGPAAGYRISMAAVNAGQWEGQRLIAVLEQLGGDYPGPRIGLLKRLHQPGKSHSK